MQNLLPIKAFGIVWNNPYLEALQTAKYEKTHFEDLLTFFNFVEIQII